jgi:hypothetical protein
MGTIMKRLLLLLSPAALSACAILHHHQLGEIDSDVVRRGRRFEILISQTGVDIQEAGNIAKAMTQHKGTQQDIGRAQAIIGLFQMGPRTGNPVYVENFADRITDQVLARCPHGRISGLSSTRETAKYPVVSGEIVKVIGYCMDKDS